MNENESGATRQEGERDRSPETEQRTENTTITVLCGANEAEAESGEVIRDVADRLHEELNIPPTYDAWISYNNESGCREDEVTDQDYVLEPKVFELEFVKPGHSKG